MAEPETLILATANEHKVREIGAMLEGCGWFVVPAPRNVADVPETGSTFAENARIKAVAVARATGRIALADDSGLVVDALDGAPGVQSRRWAGSDATDADRIVRLLGALEGVSEEKRTASFVCCACVAGPNGPLWEDCGSVEGRIADRPAGEGGFGYDPVFLLPEQGRTMAQLTAEEKNAVSHRGRAMALAARWLRDRAAGNIQ